MLLYYITDRRAFSGTESDQRSAVIERIAAAARAGVDYIQLREKDLSVRELERLAHDAVSAVRANSRTTKLLINSRTDVALACGADGVHLPGGEIPASENRALWTKACDRQPIIGVSAHSVEEVGLAYSHGADFAVLAPIFEKEQTAGLGIGLDVLRQACIRSSAQPNVEGPASGVFAVLALGGVTLANAAACIAAGAAGIAGIRLFQQGSLSETVRRLREIEVDGEA